METIEETNPVALAAHDPSAQPAGAQCAHEYGLVFTGSGREYFRIWIVNLALSIATLGIYSAWAKVRRLKYFYRNTLLDGCAFNFHANPVAILRGRIFAVALALAYHLAIGFSLVAGIAVAASLVLGLPFLLMNALRFSLRNTSYRGLRFGFAGRSAGAYLTYTPVVLLFLLPGAIAMSPESREYASLAVLPYLAWPWMFAAMKRYQHRNLLYAHNETAYKAPTFIFFKAYLVAGLIIALSVVMIGMVVGLVTLFVKPMVGSNVASAVTALAGVVAGYIVVLAAGPYTTLRIAEMAWNHTRLSGISFNSQLDGAALLKLQTRNTALTLLTLGLYRPFAVVSVYQFRIACLTVVSSGPLAGVLAGAKASAPGAAGDGTADMLGFDLAW